MDMLYSVGHRDPDRQINRPIYTGFNGGQKLLGENSQIRAGYDAHPEWPLVDMFPDHILADPNVEISREEFFLHCGSFTVLPYFYRQQATAGGILAVAMVCRSRSMMQMLPVYCVWRNSSSTTRP